MTGVSESRGLFSRTDRHTDRQIQLQLFSSTTIDRQDNTMVATRKRSLPDAAGLVRGIDDRATCRHCFSVKTVPASEPRQRNNAWNAVLSCDYYVMFVPPLAHAIQIRKCNFYSYY